MIKSFHSKNNYTYKHQAHLILAEWFFPVLLLIPNFGLFGIP